MWCRADLHQHKMKAVLHEGRFFFFFFTQGTLKWRTIIASRRRGAMRTACRGLPPGIKTTVTGEPAAQCATTSNDCGGRVRPRPRLTRCLLPPRSATSVRISLSRRFSSLTLKKKRRLQWLGFGTTLEERCSLRSSVSCLRLLHPPCTQRCRCAAYMSDSGVSGRRPPYAA